MNLLAITETFLESRELELLGLLLALLLVMLWVNHLLKINGKLHVTVAKRNGVEVEIDASSASKNTKEDTLKPTLNVKEQENIISVLGAQALKKEENTTPKTDNRI